MLLFITEDLLCTKSKRSFGDETLPVLLLAGRSRLFVSGQFFWKRGLFGTSCLWETGKQAGTNTKGLYRQKRDIRKRNVFNKQQSQSTRKIIDAGAPLSPVSRQNDARISAKVRTSCLPNVYPPGALALQGLRAFSPPRSGPPVYRDVYPA